MTQQITGPLSIEQAVKHARALLQECGGYYPAAKVLGDPNLRASIWLLLKKGRPPSTRLKQALEQWASIKTVIIKALPGIPIIGEVGLLQSGKVKAIIFIAVAERWERHLIPCQVCQAMTPRWSSSQKYCDRHSWSTREGRRYHRQQRKEIDQ